MRNYVTVLHIQVVCDCIISTEMHVCAENTRLRERQIWPTLKDLPSVNYDKKQQQI